MNKILLNVVILFVVVGLTSCSYSPIFIEKNYNFEIGKVIFSGESRVNKVIENKLKLIRNNESKNNKVYNLEIYSKKKKNIISKDTKGDPLKFEMIISVEYKIIRNEILILEKEIEKNNIYNNDSDLFELEQTERIIIDNISGNISDNIVSSIINLDDN